MTQKMIEAWRDWKAKILVGEIEKPGCNCLGCFILATNYKD